MYFLIPVVLRVKILGPCQKPEKTEKHEIHSDSNCC